MAMFLDQAGIPDELLPYKHLLSPRFFELRSKILKFCQEQIDPAREVYQAQKDELLKTVSHAVFCPEPPIVDVLRSKAKEAGLYNFFLPEVSGLTVLEYSPIAELLGAYPLANLAMNCSAPDTGNMEVLEKYGTAAQKKQWLEPLLQGKIRSAFAMTEPGVASSDATNIATRIDRDGDDYVINGHKWWISGSMRPECKVFVLLGKTRFDGPRHLQQSMILVPRDAPGVNILRPLAVFGHEHDHAEIIFDNVRVPASNLLLGEGRGFEIAQGRLGPGRIHHCMRTIGVAEGVIASMVHRTLQRTAFGTTLDRKDTIREKIAEARLELTMVRQLCYLAAVMADEKGFKAARKYIAMIKVAAPRAALRIADEAIQMHGAHGVSQDCQLSEIWTGQRVLRVADGPDIVHLNTIVQMEFAAAKSNPLGARISGTNTNIKRYGKFDHLPADYGKYGTKVRAKL
eukprot:TRINITY_DN828_c0_g2_i1.p1 TRINITY_DN828_c0_g2~~TRINITY_DN828_c0_g2_i1.p1  ORF type:complete len:457 (-),score=153.60 TRINITY_DN828_c0_g2_i1:92-1462(-)